jgi:endonuclease/exonuclease/phosphatase family metal-dependent hydrolase
MPVTFTFGTYNTEFGGIDNGNDERLRHQLALLAEAEADAWALQECNGWQDDDGRYLYLAEQALGMRGFIARSNRGRGCDPAVFVRESPDVRVTGHRHEEQPPYWHGVALVTAEIGGVGPVRLASAHLAPSAPSLRAVEAEAFALIAEKHGHGPLIAGGDWNAFPSGSPVPDTIGLHPGKVRRKADTRAAQALEEYMTDVAMHLGDATPTVGHRRSDRLAYRCDRIYTTLPDPAITGCRVVREAEPQSDHRPVLATFAIGA